MILFMTTTDDGVELGFVWLSHEEEYEFATWVMDVLSLLWLDTVPEFSEFMNRLYRRKCNGNDITFDTFLTLLDYVDRYKDLLPPIPDIIENDKRITAPASITDSEERKAYIVRERVRAWKEMWEVHPLIRGRGYPVFKTRDTIIYPDGFEDAQKQREEDFWAEVSKVQGALGCSRQQAIQEVSDYMVRAQDNYKLSDPTKRKDV